MGSHVSRKQLLQHLDGELSRFAARKVSRHLRTCRACMLESDHLKKELATITEAQLQVFEPSPPAPPNPWPSMESLLDTAPDTGTRLWKKSSEFPRGSWRPVIAWSVAAFTIALLGGLIWGPLTSVSANETIRKAAAADTERLKITSNEVVRQRVRVKKTGRLASIDPNADQSASLESWQSAQATYWKSGDNPVNAELQNHYEANGFSSALPLSPSALSSWVRLAGADPTASREGQQIEIRVPADSDGRGRGLLELSFRVQTQTWHVNEMSLSFKDATFEIDEENTTVLERRDVPADVLAVLEPKSAISAHTQPLATDDVPAANQAVPAPNLDDLEVAVRFDLHRMGADLGESVEFVAHPPDRLIVNASGASLQVKQQLATLLANKEGIELQLQAAAGSAGGRQTVQIAPVPQSALQQPDGRLLKFFGNADAEEQYTRSVLQDSNNVLGHLYALQDLASKWPQTRESKLSADAKAKLSAIVRDHIHDAQIDVSRLRTKLDLLLKGMGFEAPDDTRSANVTTWREGGLMALDAARQVDQVLRSLLTTSGAPLSSEDGLPKLQRGARKLEQSARELLTSAP